MKANLKYILSKHSIMEYLQRLGHAPVKRIAGRAYYLCPLPGHKESKPSFVVWTDAAYENFYCFGCQRSSNLLHLMCFMEEIGRKDAFRRLAGDEKITIDKELEYVIEQNTREQAQWGWNPITELSSAVLSISSLCRSYLESAGMDGGEVGIIDKLMSTVDGDLFDYNIDGLYETLKNLPLTLHARREKFEKSKFEKMQQEYQARNVK